MHCFFYILTAVEGTYTNSSYVLSHKIFCILLAMQLCRKQSEYIRNEFNLIVVGIYFDELVI